MRIGYLTYFALLLTLVLGVGCSRTAYNAVTYGSDDMYGTMSQSYLQEQEQQKQLQQQARREVWSQSLGFSNSAVSQSIAFDASLYDTPYGRKILALYSDEYQRPDSYYSLEYQERLLDKLQSYDPALYSASIDELGVVSIEPKYSSSIYGAWDNVVPYYYSAYPSYAYPYWGYYSTWGYARPQFGWGIGYYDPFYSPYYSPYWGAYPLYMPPPRRLPVMVAAPRAKSIVKTPSSTTVYSTGKTQKGGATVGTTTKKTTTNRGFNSSTTRSTSTVTRTPTTTPSTPSSSGGRTNSIGR